jgi:hypothetical protein
MQEPRWLPLESHDREQRRRLWSQIPQQDQNEFIVRCASLIARAARIVAPPQKQEERDEAGDR